MKAMIVASTLLALAACKDKSGTAQEPTGSGGSAVSSAVPAKGDVEVAAAMKILATVKPVFADHKYECPAMKAAFDPVLVTLQPESKQILDGMKDPAIAKRLADMNNPSTALGAAWTDATKNALDCPDVAKPLEQALGQKF